ncbi:hypothetical protein BBK36DRAFT_1168882 [Trichoderma citrinoviride]|uniref:Uncharacterized protein n=1 Tax=Trichoderma citrinoviride TaxID=58853 RepID=A0A2T4BAB3_9HYPO|nr:hypothetical protein BBK36DRAFT_1168882 [Trichoderma citrinoviride]PTB66265.1 hypothetical protein BBK36DRAFT_1168882 [Trichoderma citrinoviride]
MARDQLLSRRSSRHGSRPTKTCNAPDCHRERMSKSHDGETRTSKFCQRHSCSLSPSLGLCCAGKRSSDAFCHEHSTCVVEGCKSRIDPASSSRRLCLQHKCHIQNCDNRVDAPSYNFCWAHDRAIFDSFRYKTHILPVAVYAATTTPSPSPSLPPSSPRLSIRKEPAASADVSSEDSLGVPRSSSSSATPSVREEPTVQDAAAPGEQRLERQQVEIAGPAAGQDKFQTGKEEEEGLPAFFSGVGVGLCILLQIIYAVVQLLLELVRGGRRGW